MRFLAPEDFAIKAYDAGGRKIEIEQIADFAAAVARIEAALGAKDGVLPDSVIPYYCAVWPAADVLARALISFCQRLPEPHPAALRVLELGCGLGVPSLVAASLGCAVTAVDANADALDLLVRNANRNQLAVTPVCSDWRTLGWETLPSTFDLIVASDVLYEPHHAESLAGVASRWLSPNGCLLLSDPCRWHYQDFIRVLKREGFAVTVRFEDVFDRDGRTRVMLATTTFGVDSSPGAKQDL